MPKRTDAAPQITAGRAARLYRLLSLLGHAPQPRGGLLRKLKIDLRGYYRDLELLRSLGVAVAVVGTQYTLVGPLDDALACLPFPDPGLNFRDAIVLARGTTDAHRKFRKRVESVVGSANGNGKPARVAAAGRGG